MAKESVKESLLAKICTRIIRCCIYTTVFLIPIFFLPFTSDVLDFNKQTLLLFLGMIAFFAWIIKVLVTKRMRINVNKINLVIGGFLLIYIISSMLSLWAYGSFWGWPQSVSESSISLISLVIFYFLVANLFSKEEIIKLILTVCSSALIALVFGISQIMGWFILPFDFAKDVSFNTIGATVGSLGLFVIALFPLALSFLGVKKWQKVLLFLGLILTLGLLIIVNYPVLWWLAIIGSAMIIGLGVYRRDKFDSRWLILPMFFLALGLFFVVLRPTISFMPKIPTEIFLNQKSSYSIALQSVKESPLFGSGPGTFGNEFLKFKNLNFNSSIFWNTRFEAGISQVATILATTGILGILGYLFFLGCVVFYGIKIFFIKKSVKETHWELSANVFISILVLTIGFFFRNSNFSINFLYFFLLAALIALTSNEFNEYELESSSIISLVTTFAFTLCFIFGIGLLILDGQKYVAETYYTTGLTQWQKGNYDVATNDVLKAAGLNNGSDLYLRQLSQIYMARLTQVLSDKNIVKDKKTKDSQLFFNNMVNSAKSATDVGPNNIANWANRGYVYQNLVGLVPNVEGFAIDSYDKAAKLDPINPYYLTQQGIVYLNQALTLGQEQQASKTDILLRAQGKFEDSIRLKSDYAAAIYQLAAVLSTQGKTAESIKKLEEAEKYAPSDIGLIFQLGSMYYQNKDYPKAQIEFEKIISISPNYSNAVYFSGLTYYKQGDTAKAIERIKAVMQLNPDNQDLKTVLANMTAGKDPLAGIGQQAAPSVVEQKPKTK